ncbi:MAG: HNH endonuclease [Halofilum sp. (in: g-proteobacteria)]|nr:HNH endonuclease [Halofilum sp. (in: g-proteobacteria)]
MDPSRQDAAVRKAAFDFLEAETARHGEVLPRQLLADGFEWEGQRVPLVSAQGIFKPKVLPEIPLTITTSPKSPYADSFADSHRLLYRYRGTDPRHRDNVGLREAMHRGTPLIYFVGLTPGRYLAIWPVLIVGDDPSDLCFTVVADSPEDTVLDRLTRGSEHEIRDSGDEARRSYITSTVRRRLHQHSFRERVLRAYQERCALCRLRHWELLDASHIIPDSDPLGEPDVTNGLALCKIHHAAFDANFLGIRPDDYRIEIRKDVLDEQDGPMLRHGLQGMHGQKLHLPRTAKDRPAKESLEYRYELFMERQT